MNVSEDSDDDVPVRKRTRRASSSSQGQQRRTRNSQRSRRQSSGSDDDVDPDDVLEDIADLDRPKRTRQSRRQEFGGIAFEDKPRRNRAQVNYRIATLPEVFQIDAEAQDEPQQARTNGKKKKGANWRPLVDVAGPFGGFGGPPALIPGRNEEIPLGGGEPDSSDDEEGQLQPKTPGAAGQDAFGGPANFGKVNKGKKAMAADTDPLGIDENVGFDGVGGLDDHISSLKEMVVLPLLYPEIFQQFKITPPRGVLFHGPPGTGKTLLARALSNSVSVDGQKKVTFFMRKGADALSKWVGEAERQLRLLFEEAQKSQPAIIFFDEIDGLAPVRSSKTEQIHASIVATLLALMDGMDNRGQVIVIGATNRPDNVDPALRRPGRFDREFYFPLPDQKARRSMIDIHTKGWEPPLKPEFKDQLSELTTGYGGADIRALCTEAAINAVQGTFPQIYQSNKKLEVDPSKIKVLAKDFMISVNKIVPSSARTNTTNVEPLAKNIEPLLRKPVERITKILDQVLPRRPKLTALQEAEFDDRDDTLGFERETLQRELDRARVFRPRLLVRGLRGMGQQHIASAILHKLEGLFVQSFDMATLLEDSTRTPEAAVVQLFKEVRRQKPSVIFIPSIDVWYETAGANVIKIFCSQLRSIPPNDPVLLLGMMESDNVEDKPQPSMLKDLFGFSSNTDYQLERPDKAARHEYFEALIGLIRKRPSEFPDPETRKRRRIEPLEAAREDSQINQARKKEQDKKQRKADRHALNMLKLAIQPVMDELKKKYRRFFNPVIDPSKLEYLFADQDPNVLTSDLTEEQRQQQMEERPYVIDKDRRGVGGFRDVATGKFYYNLDLLTIEVRLSNGYYKRYKDFYADILRLAKDASQFSDAQRTIQSNEMVTNVEVDMSQFETRNMALDQELAALFVREQNRQKEKETKAAAEGEPSMAAPANVPGPSMTTTETTGPIVLGAPVPGRPFFPPVTPARRPALSNGDTSSRQTNGSTVPSRPFDEDIHMTDSEGAAFGALNSSKDAFIPSAAAHTSVAPPHQHSQRSALEKMAPGSQIDDYHNSASTTTSGLNHSSHNQSNRTSGHSNHPLGNTQSSNGTDSRYFPNISSAGALAGGSQIPDTQPNSDQASADVRIGDSVTQPNTTHHTSNIASLLNDPSTKQPELRLKEESLRLFHQELVDKTSGMSVEQLEQIMSILMNAVWRCRGEWDKDVVVKHVLGAFNEGAKDIEKMQYVMENSNGDREEP